MRTSTPGPPDRQRLTEEFWLDRLPSYEPLISALVIAEIRDTPDPDKRRRLEALVQSFAVLPVTAEAEDLADEYVDRGVVQAKFRDDALHVALAVTEQIPLLASWNFKHLVKLQVRRQINLINAMLGFGQIDIVSPAEL
ncbi:MAG: type II toxin-antitoxin system VapC family toxin [Candidatus Anammoximicrobium sp.]|nr:type II toxin-antitoxin system VapC family toxin [Candidatus Anammoximicrobium sp.]